MEALNEHERNENGNTPRDVTIFSPEMLSIRGMVDTIGSVVVISTIDETHEIIETST